MKSLRITALVALALLAMPMIAQTPALRRAKLTFYWMIDEDSARYRRGSDVVLRNARGHVIAHTTSTFRRALIREGAGTLRDGRIVVYDRRLGGEHRFRLASHPLTVSGCGLVPFRTVAVDPRVIKLGSKIYVPQLKGARLPDGSIHDGVFVATDCGNFRGHHIDVFVGDGPQRARPFVQRGYPSRSHVTVYLLERPSSARAQK